MKGFPNQIADIPKLLQGIRTVASLTHSGGNARDDGELGEQLIRDGVLGTGHRPIPVEDYLRQQLRKPTSGQSFRTSARGLRELYRLLGLLEERSGSVYVTADGRAATELAGAGLGATQITFWRRLVRNLQHQGGDATTSHPYQVLLRLVARKPGITRAKCALALEARDDSAEELERIVALADLDEVEIRRRIGVTRANWDNAKKVLPRFAEQLGDVVEVGSGYRLADTPGNGDQITGQAASSSGRGLREPIRRPRSARAVSPETIGTAGIGERDDAPPPPNLTPEAAASANRLRADRLRRHNLLVRRLAARLAQAGMALYEDPFDTLAVAGSAGFLVEVKTLDGTQDDERERVRDALGQLLYYEAFVTEPIAAEATIHKLACFESAVTLEHREWLNRSGIGVIWIDGQGFAVDDIAKGVLRPFLGEFR